MPEGYGEEMRFVNELRARHYHDLALQYLERLSKDPSPELKRELPLELAKTRLETAADEPDSGRRLAIYGQALAELQTFLKENPTHPRAGEVNLDIAQVAVLKGKTQLSRALLQDSLEARVAEGLKARASLEGAGQELRRAAADLDARLAKLPQPRTPAERAVRKRLEDERLRAELSVGLNLFDQAQTFLDEGKTDVLLERAKKVQEAQKVLEKVAAGDPVSPLVWQARAWLGRCQHELGDPRKARAKYLEILEAGRVAAEGQRLARYFRLLVIKDNPDPEEKPRAAAMIIDRAEAWVLDYPSYLNTPEGYGVRYLLAEMLLAEAENPKAPPGKRQKCLADARRLVRAIERTENDFTDRARRLKIGVIQKQGGFTRPVASLKGFEDCYVRAQFEILQMGEDARRAKDEKELEKARKGRVDTVIRALERGLAQPDAQTPSPEVNNARAMLAFYCLGAGRYREAVRVGEEFARRDPRSSQAITAAVYALQAYVKMVAQREARFEDVREDRAGMLALAKYMEGRWPRELAGDLARHQIGLLLLREKNYPEAVRKLGAVTAAYPSYAFAQLQLADCAFEAEKEGLEPLPGDKPGDYRRRAVEALRRIPDGVVGPDPSTNYVYLLGKARLGRELFKEKKYKEMGELASALRARLPGLALDADKAAHEKRYEQVRSELADLTLYAQYGLAEAELARGDHAAVARLVDPLVAEVNEGKLPELKKNPQLALALLSMGLKSNIQLGKVAQTRAVLQALRATAAEDGGDAAGGTGILKQLVGLIHQQVGELRKKGDKDTLKKAVEGFTAILDDLIKQQKTPTPEFMLLLGQCYGGMDQHGKAAALLEKVPEPRAAAGAARPDPKAVSLYRGVQILLVRELRLTGDKDKVAQASKLLDEVLGTKEKPGWGAGDLSALKERGLLLEASGQYAEAYSKVWVGLVRQLVRVAGTDNAKKEHYLECYYHLVYCYYKHAQGMSDAGKKADAIKAAAVQVVQLEKKWDGFGSDASRKRFTELLDKEADLKKEYEQLKGK
jgi:tetratricopeptide (TPR) repeat protein